MADLVEHAQPAHANGSYAHNSADAATHELHTAVKTLSVDFRTFYGFTPTRVDRKFTLRLSDLSYLPKIDNPRADWVVTAAFAAFDAFEAASLGTVHRFATVGTGSGTDVIAALETFPWLQEVAMTHMHEEVVNVAKANILSATEKADDHVRNMALHVIAKAGDVLLPLMGQGVFDLIYENLPNIPLPRSRYLAQGQTSSTYVGDRKSNDIPHFVSAALLDLHYVCLAQARTLGLVRGSSAILSSMGGRVPIGVMMNMAEAAGYNGRVLVLSWKEQSEPEAVIGGYADHEQNGLGPFHFYPVTALKCAFKNRTSTAAGLRASQIEDELLPDRLDATTALGLHRQGIIIGHTVVVMASVLKSVLKGL